MMKLFTAAAVACLLAASPALAEHKTTTHNTTVVHGGNGNTRTVHTTHVNLIRGGHESSRTFTHVTTTHNFHGHASTRNTARNFRSFRRNFTAPRRFHYGSYNRPHGWYAHRWVYGERLPRGWYGRDYWIGDYLTFGLIGPPDGYQWVRDGDDALLVDIDTGEVLQVEYGVFY